MHYSIWTRSVENNAYKALLISHCKDVLRDSGRSRKSSWCCPFRDWSKRHLFMISNSTSPHTSVNQKMYTGAALSMSGLAWSNSTKASFLALCNNSFHGTRSRREKTDSANAAHRPSASEEYSSNGNLRSDFRSEAVGESVETWDKAHKSLASAEDKFVDNAMAYLLLWPNLILDN